MNALVRVDRILRGTAAVAAIVAGFALLRPPSVPDATLPVDGLAAPTLPHAPITHDAAARVQTILQANLFSAARTPPAVRYSPLEPDAENVDAMFFEEPDADPGAGGEDEVPKLYGTVIGPAGPIALLRLDPARPDAQVYREGDRAAGWRVHRINEQSVVLDGPEGRIVLRLIRPEGSTP